MMGILRFWKKTLSFDDRSMAFYRVLIGIIIMSDVIYRLPDLTNFYTDVGLIPRSIFITEMGMPWSFSLHLANGSLLFIAIMFALHFLSGLLVTVGYKSRASMIFAFIMTVSVHNRNWLVNNGGDDVLRAILFFSIFLPLNRVFSLDSALRTHKKKTEDFFSMWTLTFFLQVFAIYFVSYILKDHPIWRSDFTAVFFSSRLDIFATPFGVFLRDFPTLMKISTFFTIYLEWLGPLVLVFGFIFGKVWWIVRVGVIALFVGLHLGIFSTMNIGLFPFICIAMWMIFIPGPFWDKVLGHFRKKKYGELKIYFDRDCGFCEKGVRVIREFFLLSEVKILKGQDDKEIFKLMEKNHSWVVVDESGEASFAFDAFNNIISHSPLMSWSSRFFRTSWVQKMGGGIYKFVSNRRALFGKITQFFRIEESKRELLTVKVFREALGVLFLVTLFMWNLTTIKKYQIKAPFFQGITRWVHIYQEWNMFSPYPKMDNVWIEVPAELSDGTQIDAITGSREVFEIGDQKFYEAIPNEHWRKFYLNLTERNSYSKYFGSYLCRKWNDRKIRWVEESTLRKLEIIVYSQMNLSDGEKGGIKRGHSWKHWCFDEDFKKDHPSK